MNIYVLLICAALSFFTGMRVEHWRVGASQTEAADIALDKRVAGEQKTAALEGATDKALSSDRAIANDQQNKVEESRAKNPNGYRCIVPADGMQQYRAAIGRTAAGTR